MTGDSNVFVLTVDSLQYSRSAGWLPALADRTDAVEFTDAVATAPQTASAMPGLAAGVYHDALETRGLSESGDPRPLAEILAAHGYTCGLWTDNFLFGEEYGYDRGFSAGNLGRPSLKKRVANAVREGPLSPLFGPLEWAYFNVYQRVADAASEDSQFYAPARDLNREALRWLDGGVEGPTMCWLHYMDTHHPYQPPAEYLADRSFNTERSRSELGEFTRHTVKNNGENASADDVEDFATAYDACCEYVGDELVDFVDTLVERGHFDPDRDVLVVTADHGECLTPEPTGMLGHLPAAYWEEIVRVPLLIARPDWSRETVEDQVSLIDVMPTVLRAVDAPVPEGLAGESAAEPADLVREYAYGVSQPYSPDGPTQAYRMVRGADGWKLFGADRRGRDEILLTRFDGAGQAHEEIRYVSGSEEPPGEEELAARRSELLERIEAVGPPLQQGRTEIADSERLESHLEDLGYLE